MKNNYINNKMNKKDVLLAFDLKSASQIYNLIGEGLLRKADRHFVPTEKLLDREFLPEVLELDESQRRFFSRNSNFYKKDAITILGGALQGEQILKWFIRNGYIDIIGGRYCVSSNFSDWLAEGESVIYIKSSIKRGEEE